MKSKIIILWKREKTSLWEVKNFSLRKVEKLLTEKVKNFSIEYMKNFFLRQKMKTSLQKYQKLLSIVITRKKVWYDMIVKEGKEELL